MSFLLAATLLLFAPGDVPADAPGLPVEIETLDAGRVSGNLRAIDGAGLVRIHSDGADRTIAVNGITEVRPVLPRRIGTQANAPICLVHFADGGRLHASLADSDKPGHVALDAGFAAPLVVPFNALAGIRFAVDRNAADSDFARRLDERRAGRDLLIAIRDGKEIVMPGAVEAIDADGWAFRFKDREISAPLDSARSVVFGAVPGKRRNAPAALHLAGGDRLLGRVVSADADHLRFDPTATDPIAIPWARVDALRLRSNRLVSLVDLEPVAVRQDAFFGQTWPVRRNRSVTGAPLSVDGRVYDRGIGVHAGCTLVYELPGTFERFSMYVAIDDAARPNGNVLVRIVAGDHLVFESEPITGRTPPQKIDVKLRGARRLELTCDMGDELDLGDHVDWLEPVLIRPEAPAERSR